MHPLSQFRVCPSLCAASSLPLRADVIYDPFFWPLLCCGVAPCLPFISELSILLYIPFTWGTVMLERGQWL
jgi:hypothetical protein